MNEHKKRTSVKRQIDENLKRAFDDLASEQVPDRFTQLLDQLRAKEAGAAKAQEQSDDK